MKPHSLFLQLALVGLGRVASPTGMLCAATLFLAPPVSVEAQMIDIAAITGFGGVAPNNDYTELINGDFGAAGNVVQFSRAGTAGAGGAGKTAYATIDLGTVQSLDRLRVIGRNSSGIPNLSMANIEVSTDGITWATVRSMDYRAELSLPAANKSGNAYTIGFATQTARYVRVNLTNTAVSEQISQFQVYNGGGPRVSLVDHGSNLNQTAVGLTDKYPSLLVDGISTSSSNFVLYNGASGYFTLRLDSPEYDQGWDKVSLWGRGTGSPSNPAEITVYAGDSLETMVAIHTESFAGTTSDWNYILDMGATYTADYIKIEWAAGSFTPANVQFKEVDVLPIPEPSALALGVVSVLMISIVAVRRRHAV